ncbi:MAG: pyruvate:ferredoxin (flavodoxin) oxidoreductase [Fimbriimonadaceae bacterium]
MSKFLTIDGNEAAAYVAYRCNEVIAIYPITPSSGMGELADAWMSSGVRNIWGEVPTVVEMQSEGGAAGAVHGSLQTGAMTTTFTASQGLLLMVPNMYKIAGELTPTVFHISARSLAAQGLSIFGDHSDVMATRSSGWGMMFSSNVQEVMDFALITQAITLRSRVPFLHVFDGFRTSHEVSKIVPLTDEQIRAFIDEDLVRQHRERALNPDRPVMRGTAQNPDVYFQGRETVNPFYNALPEITRQTLIDFAKLTGRRYKLFDYVGHRQAERVIVMMGSGVGAAEEAIEKMNADGERVGLLKVRLYRPFCQKCLLNVLPAEVKSIAVLDRTKEPGAGGEPLYLDCITGITEGMHEGDAPFTTFPQVIGGRYGLSSKEFTPAMVKAVFDELAKPQPKNHFTVGIVDDVAHTSLDVDPSFDTETDDVKRAVFWGLGSDGTVGANKNSIKIIGEETDLYAQGYFVYDSKKSGSVTTSHLRFGPRPIKSSYLITKANFVAVHQFGLLFRYPVLDTAMPGATVLINSPYGPDEVWSQLPSTIQKTIVDRNLKLYVIDAYSIAREAGMGGRINTIMQTAFFALSNVLPKEEAIQHIREAIEKTYGKRGRAVVEQNFKAVDRTLEHLLEVEVPTGSLNGRPMKPPVVGDVPEFVKNVTAEIIAGRGDRLPVSAMPVDGTFPTGTTQYEKRSIAAEVPVWDPDICTQCGKCVMVCPHAVIRAKLLGEDRLPQAPAGFKIADPKWRGTDGHKYAISVSVEDCTGCALCVEVCPAKDKTNPARRALEMADVGRVRDEQAGHWDFFLGLPDRPALAEPIRPVNVKNIQLERPLFEFSGACAGCGETPYLKLLSQLFGDRSVIANATGCSSIYGGNLPTTPWTKNADGRGPAWSNSLFEDNAEFGLGMRMALDMQKRRAENLLRRLAHRLPAEAVDTLLAPLDRESDGIARKRAAADAVKSALAGDDSGQARDLVELVGALVDKCVWIVGGDGWAYDIGYGGLDHVLASGQNVNILVLDTEVYSNTGGQASKSTARGAVAKFAAGGKPGPKKDLGMMAITYGEVYVAQVAMGANDAQTVKAFLEAEAYPGPSLIIAYSHCIAHGIDMRHGMRHQRQAVESGYWPLYRFNPSLREKGRNPFVLDSKEPTLPLKDYIYTEARYRMLLQSDPSAAAELLRLAEQDVQSRLAAYQTLAQGTGANS